MCSFNFVFLSPGPPKTQTTHFAPSLVLTRYSNDDEKFETGIGSRILL